MKDKTLLFLCTGNSCRSQMAEGLFNYYLGSEINCYSAGTEKHGLNPFAVTVMNELNIDISHHKSKTLDEFSPTLITCPMKTPLNKTALPFSTPSFRPAFNNKECENILPGAFIAFTVIKLL